MSIEHLSLPSHKRSGLSPLFGNLLGTSSSVTVKLGLPPSFRDRDIKLFWGSHVVVLVGTPLQKSLS